MVVNIILRLNDYSQHTCPNAAILILSIVVALLVAFGATFGGTLVYDYGFNVENSSADSPCVSTIGRPTSSPANTRIELIFPFSRAKPTPETKKARQKLVVRARMPLTRASLNVSCSRELRSPTMRSSTTRTCLSHAANTLRPGRG